MLRISSSSLSDLIPVNQVQNTTMIHEKHIQNYYYNIEALVGEGSYSQVFKGLDTTTNCPVAIKVIDRKLVQNPYCFKMIQQETNIMTHLSHQNIVKVLNVVNTVNNIYIIQEYCDGGDLSTYLQTQRLSEQQVLIILADILEALSELSSNGIMHRDIKPANIFFHQGIYKLGDFGFARQINCNIEPLENFLIGTPLYMSPQCLQRVSYNEKTDFWSLGASIYELLFGEVPWLCDSHEELRYAIYSRRIELPQEMNQNLRHFIERCLVIDENERMGIEEALELKKQWWVQFDENEVYEVCMTHEQKGDSQSKAETENLRNFEENNEEIFQEDEKTLRTTSEENQHDIAHFKKIFAEKYEETLKERKKNLFQRPHSCQDLIDGVNNNEYLSEYKEIFNGHLIYVKFMNKLKKEIQSTSEAFSEKETNKLNLLLHKSFLLHIQKLLIIFKERKNVFRLEKWEDFTKSKDFKDFYVDFFQIYQNALNDYKEIVKNLKNNSALYKEITMDEKVNNALYGEFFDNKTFYRVVLKEMKHFIREINHSIYEDLKKKYYFCEKDAQFLKMLVKFHEILNKILQSKEEILKNFDKFNYSHSCEEGVNVEYYCTVLRPLIYELNI